MEQKIPEKTGETKLGKIRLGTRTYFFNLMQSSAKNLFILDFSGKIHLGEVGIKVSNVGESYFKFLEQLLPDPFNLTQVKQYLLNDYQDLKVVYDSFATEEEKGFFNLKKRYFTYIVSNHLNFVDIMLSTVNEIENKQPLAGVVYLNHFDIDVNMFLKYFNEIVSKLKEKGNYTKKAGQVIKVEDSTAEKSFETLELEKLQNSEVQKTQPADVDLKLAATEKEPIIEHFSKLAKRMSMSGISLEEFDEYQIFEMRNLIAGIKLTSMMALENTETYLLKRGYKDLRAKYPFLDKKYDGKLFRELKRAQAFPNEIIDSYVYLGNGRHAADYNMLSSFGFTHILNVTEELPNYFDGNEGKSIKYLKVPVKDYETENIVPYFKQAYEFIEAAKSGKILIHCVLGRSRSFAFLVMFIMKQYNMGFELANEVVNERRFLGQINSGFVDQLLEFEKGKFQFAEQASK